jgi:hypothetical protein
LVKMWLCLNFHEMEFWPSLSWVGVIFPTLRSSDPTRSSERWRVKQMTNGFTKDERVLKPATW